MSYGVVGSLPLVECKKPLWPCSPGNYQSPAPEKGRHHWWRDDSHWIRHGIAVAVRVPASDPDAVYLVHPWARRACARRSAGSAHWSCAVLLRALTIARCSFRRHCREATRVACAPHRQSRPAPASRDVRGSRASFLRMNKLRRNQYRCASFLIKPRFWPMERAGRCNDNSL